MRGCLGIFVALILALLAAFVVGMGMCITGFGSDAGLLSTALIILSIPAALLTFAIVVIKLTSSPPETLPQEQAEPDENQENETE